MRWSLTLACAVVAVLSQSASSAEAPKPQFTKPPQGAIILFDGKDTSGWTRMNGTPCPWRLQDGAMVCIPLAGNIRTKKTFGDHKLHIEFKVPYMPRFKGQGRGNSGVYLQARYEVQVLDSYGIDPIKKDDCGALYGMIVPSKNVCLPPNEWQSYDITFRAPRLEDDKKTVQKGRITVVQNGITIIDDKEIPKSPRPNALGKPGPLMLQDHLCPVAFRNIWVVPID
ncbi:MAG: DUF1080 domain-containing protein [Phycisphaerae bacterium]|nr:DUF1080 domain-containing protein [Phycisphaerae bacterium]